MDRLNETSHLVSIAMRFIEWFTERGENYEYNINIIDKHLENLVETSQPKYRSAYKNPIRFTPAEKDAASVGPLSNASPNPVTNPFATKNTHGSTPADPSFSSMKGDDRMAGDSGHHLHTDEILSMRANATSPPATSLHPNDSIDDADLNDLLNMSAPSGTDAVEIEDVVTLTQ